MTLGDLEQVIRKYADGRRVAIQLGFNDIQHFEPKEYECEADRERAFKGESIWTINISGPDVKGLKPDGTAATLRTAVNSKFLALEGGYHLAIRMPDIGARKSMLRLWPALRSCMRTRVRYIIHRVRGVISTTDQGDDCGSSGQSANSAC